MPPQPPGDGAVPRGRGGGTGGCWHGPAGLLCQEHHSPALPHRCRDIYIIYNIYNIYNDYIIYLLHPTDEDIKDYESKDEVLEETLGQVRDMRQNIGLR